MGEQNQNKQGVDFSCCLQVFGEKDRRLSETLSDLIDKEVGEIGRSLLTSDSDLFEKNIVFYLDDEKNPRFECDIALEQEQTAILNDALKRIAEMDQEHEIKGMAFHFHELTARSSSRALVMETPFGLIIAL